MYVCGFNNLLIIITLIATTISADYQHSRDREFELFGHNYYQQ